MTTEWMRSNEAWLAGWHAYDRGEGIPWEDDSARTGWLANRDSRTIKRVLFYDDETEGR